MLQFKEALHLPAALRAEYLDTIPEGQELFVERLAQRGRVWQSEAVAYAVSNEHELVEFYVAADQRDRLQAYYEAAIAASGAEASLVKSFDGVMRSALGDRVAASQDVGLLFRRRVDATPAVPGVLTHREAVANDVAAILECDDGFFEGSEELHQYIHHSGLFIAERNRQLVGCGLAMEVVAGRNDVDVGMWVAPDERGRGYSAALVAHVVSRQLELGRRPIAGCDVANVASRKALERAGFVAEHRLLRVAHRA